MSPRWWIEETVRGIVGVTRSALGAKPRWRPLVAATLVQDLRFRARVLLKDAKSRMPGSIKTARNGRQDRQTAERH